MKKENVHNNSVFGNKNNTSSHYHIKSGGVKVQLMAIVKGERADCKSEYLMCSIGYRSEFITAYIEADKPVKLFRLIDYVDWECNAKQVDSVDIPLENYLNPDVFSHVLQHSFLSLNPKLQAV